MEKVYCNDNFTLFLNTDGNFYFENNSCDGYERIFLKEYDNFFDKKIKSFRELFLSIYKKDLYCKVRDVETRYLLVDGKGNELSSVYLIYSISNEFLTIELYKTDGSNPIELISCDICDIILNRNTCSSVFSKILFETKNVKLKQSSSKMKAYELKVNDFYMRYGISFRKGSYSLKVASDYLNTLDKIMLNLNRFLKVNNIFYKDDFPIVNLEVFLKRTRNETFVGGSYQLGCLSLNVEEIESLSYLETVFVHEFGHHIDTYYLRKKNIKFLRDNLVWEFLKCNESKLDYLLRNYECNGNPLTSNERIEAKNYLLSLSSYDAFINSIYFKNSSDYVKYVLDDMEIIARMFEELYLKEVNSESLNFKESCFYSQFFEFKDCELNKLKNCLKQVNLIV